MILSEICIKRPVLTTMLNLALVLFGVVALLRLPVRELPDIDPPIVTVTTVFTGASAEVVETEVTEKLEEVINSIPGIKTLESQSSEQVSSITVEFDLSRDIDLAAQDVRDRVARVRGKLPDDIEEPVVAKQDADASPVLWVALNSDRYSTAELTSIGENQLKDRLQTVPGVSSVILGGEKRFAMRLWLDSERMAARQVTVLDIERALSEQNVELPSGRVESLERELAIKTEGELKSPEQFNQLVIKEDGANLVRLIDIGRAEAGVEDERSVARYNSQPAVGLGIVRQSKANTIEVAKGIKEELERARPYLPKGINAIVAYDESIFVEAAIEEVWLTLYIAFVLVVVTIFVFLRDARSTLIPSVTVPVSALATFMVLWGFGYSINILTMLALVLAIGIVVDDSIVVLENIYRHIEEGMKPLEASFKAMREIGFAVIAITLSLVAVFLPLAFQSSVTGRLFIEFAVALCGSVLISAFVALTLTPMMSARLLRHKPRILQSRMASSLEQWFEGISRRYERWLDWSLDHRSLVGIGVGVSFVLTAFFYFTLDRDFLPEEDKGRLFNILITPEGSTSEYTDRMVRKMEKIVAETPEHLGYFTAVALARGSPGKANEGLMFVRFKPERDRNLREILQGPAGLGARFFGEVEGGLAIPIVPKAINLGFGQPFKMVIEGHDLKELNEVAGKAVNALQVGGYLANVRSTYELTKPELQVEIERDRASTLQVSIRDLARTLQILFGGLDLSKVKLAGKEYDVIAQLRRSMRLTPQDLERLYVRSRSGQLIPLSNLVRYRVEAGPNAITHYNRSRAAIIEGTPLGVSLGTAVDRSEKLMREILPGDYRIEWAGEAESLKIAARDAQFVVVLAILVVFMVLASQFESLIHPITILVSLPLAGLGAFGLLWGLNLLSMLGELFYAMAYYAPEPSLLARALSWIFPVIPAMNINLFSQVGIVLLLGLVTKNSILLVEFANQRRAAGLSAREAMREAGLVRLRPILMTAFATIAGILPIAIGFGAGAESRRPMGVAAVGGMVSSTFLTLFIIPVVYVLLSEVLQRKNRKDALGQSE